MCITWIMSYNHISNIKNNVGLFLIKKMPRYYSGWWELQRAVVFFFVFSYICRTSKSFSQFAILNLSTSLLCLLSLPRRNLYQFLPGLLLNNSLLCGSSVSIPAIVSSHLHMADSVFRDKYCHTLALSPPFASWHF